MRAVILALLLACVRLSTAANWAFLVSGAKGYSNYRHQANVCHAYQLMLQSGIPRDHIITMMVDDVAYNPRNPFQGNIINVKNGPNVYAGIKIDYRGKDVNRVNFLKVLQGQPTHVGSGRVINSTADDHIFVYYSDHGNRYFVAFPGGGLYSSKLHKTIMTMHSEKRYSKMVFYIEACKSGSLFSKNLPNNVNVYAMTAANPEESSYSCCYDRKRKTFLGDQFSGNWMRDSETHNMKERTLLEQYEAVKHRVRSSHPSLYGDITGMGGMKVGHFQGNVTTYVAATPSAEYAPITDLTPEWDVPYVMLLHDLEDANTTESRLKVLHHLMVEQKVHLAIRRIFEEILKALSRSPALLMEKMGTHTSKEQDACYERTVDKYLQTCTEYQEYDYAMKDIYVFDNLCNKGISSERINNAIESVCSG